MSLKSVSEVWDDVLDEALDERQAPEIAEVVAGSAHKIYSDPKEFFSRTYLSSPMRDVLANILRVFAGRGGNNVLILYSLFGGGKTHTLIAIYHAFSSPDALAVRDPKIASEIRTVPRPRIVTIFGKDNNFSGRPSKPLDFKTYKVRTVWGYLAHCLGKYDEVKVDDRNLTAPDISSLRALFGLEPTLVLIDEIADYGVNLLGSTDPVEKKYAENLKIFLDRLATAAVGTKAVIVVTFPIKTTAGKKDQIDAVEERYASQERYVTALWDAAKRVASKIIAPLEPEEVVSVLKCRIFRKQDATEAQRISQELRYDYEASKDIFGNEAYGVATKLSGTWPYHPDYVEVLRDIVERAGLQRTRDLIRVTRSAVRQIWSSKDDPAIIMPWHIDLSEGGLKSLLLKGANLKDYAVAVDRDILDNTVKCTKPKLARITATAIFLKTFVYDTPTPINQCPTEKEVARLSYEPATFVAEKWKPADIPDIVKELQSNLIFLHEKDERYWFWRIASIKEQVEAEAKKLREQSPKLVTDWLTGYVDDAAWGKLDLTKGRKEVAAKKKSSIFAQVKPVTSIRDLEIFDDGHYKLLILVSDSVVGDELKKEDDRSKELIGNVIFQIAGKPRNERNTIYVLLPSTQELFARAIELSARRIACDKVTDEIEAIYKGAGKEVVDVQRGIINTIKDQTLRRLGEIILNTYTSIAFPSTSNGTDCVKIADTPTGTASTSLIDAAESALSQAGFDKFYPSMSFHTLEGDFKKRLGIDLVDGDKSPFVRDIKSHFKTNPRLPAVDDAVIEAALKEGLRALEIGLTVQDNVRYKKIHETPPTATAFASDTEGDEPSMIGNDDLVLPWKTAIERQTSQLVGTIGLRREGDRALKQWYEVVYHGKLHDLRELVTQPNWHDIAKLGFIVRRTEEIKEKFLITLQPASKTVRPKEALEVTVKVEPIGKYKFGVALIANTGSLAPPTGNPPYQSVWKLNAPEDPGEYRLELNGKGGDPKESAESATLTLLIERDVIDLGEITANQVGNIILGVKGLKRFDDLTSLEKAFSGRKITALVQGQVVADTRTGSSLTIGFNRIDVRVARQMSEDAKSYVEGEIKEMRLEVATLGDPTIDEPLVRELSELNKRVDSFLVKRRMD